MGIGLVNTALRHRAPCRAGDRFTMDLDSKPPSYGWRPTETGRTRRAARAAVTG